MFNTTSVLLLLSGTAKNNVMMLHSGILSAFVKYTVLNPCKGLEGSLTEEDRIHWHASLNQCLQCMAVLLIEPCMAYNAEEERLYEMWEQVVADTEASLSKNIMLSSSSSRKFGKSSRVNSKQQPRPPPPPPPEKVSLLVSSLESFAGDDSDPIRSISARRILVKLKE